MRGKNYPPLIKEINLNEIAKAVYDTYRSINGKSKEVQFIKKEILNHYENNTLFYFFKKAFNFDDDLANLLEENFNYYMYHQSKFLRNRSSNFLLILAKLKVVYDYLTTNDNTTLDMLYFILLHNLTTNFSVNYTYNVFGDKYREKLRQFPSPIYGLQDFLYHLLTEDKFTQVNMVENRSWIIIDLDIGLQKTQFRHIAKITKELEKFNLAPTFILRTDKGGFQVFYAVKGKAGDTTLYAEFWRLWLKYKEIFDLFHNDSDVFWKIAEKVEKGKANLMVEAIVTELLVQLQKGKRVKKTNGYKMWLFSQVQARYVKLNKHKLNITNAGYQYAITYAFLLSIWQEMLEWVAGDVKKYQETYMIDSNAIEGLDTTPRIWRNLVKNRLIYFQPKIYDIYDFKTENFIKTKYAGIWYEKLLSKDKIKKENKENDKKSLKINKNKKEPKNQKNLLTQKELMYFERNFDFETKTAQNYYNEMIKPLCELYGVTEKEEELFKRVWYNGFVEREIPVKILQAEFKGSQGQQWGFMSIAYHFVPYLLLQPEMKNQGLPKAHKALRKFLSVTFTYVNKLIKNPLKDDELMSFIDSLYAFYTTNYRSKFKNNIYEIFMFTNVKRRFEAIEQVKEAIISKKDFSEIANDVNKIKEEIIKMLETTKKSEFREAFGISQSTYYKWINQDLFDELVIRLALKIQALYEVITDETLSNEEKQEKINEIMADIEFISFVVISVDYQFYLAHRVSTYEMIDNAKVWFEEKLRDT